jgi:hypothetical protein
MHYNKTHKPLSSNGLHMLQKTPSHFRQHRYTPRLDELTVSQKMWNLQSSTLNSQTVAVALSSSQGVLSYRDVINLWEVDKDFRTFFTEGVAASPFQAFFWETPPVSTSTLDRKFEYVIVEGTALQGLRPDPNAFQSHFLASKSKSVVSFPNLGGDAFLIVPSPVSAEGCYTHLANFLRLAPTSQVDEYWTQVGAAMKSRVSHAPIWLSTAGLGVSWLHLRLDSRPKYYRHAPYKKIS